MSVEIRAVIVSAFVALVVLAGAGPAQAKLTASANAETFLFMLSSSLEE